MSDFLAPSELILNEDGSIYHLNLKPDQVSPLIITVGDPARVRQVTSHFDSIEVSIQKREFHTCTGTYKGKRITVISTGIGTDNIDIVFNELDALFNVNLETRKIKNEFTPLTFIRIGTSGALQKDVNVDSVILSEYAFGMDSLMHFYNRENMTSSEEELEKAIKNKLPKELNQGYIASGSSLLLDHFSELGERGITLTCSGFYAPQGRSIRLGSKYEDLISNLRDFDYQSLKVTNLEMETSGIYGLAHLLGHQAISINAILANRALNTFSKNPKETVSQTIVKTLEKITEL